MQWIFALLSFVVVASATQAQAAEWQKTWDETLTAAKKEGRVVVGGPPDAEVRQLLPAAFEKRYGIKLEYLSARGTDQAIKLQREREAGALTVDAVIAGIQTTATVLYANNMLAPLRPQLILPDVVDGKNWKRGSLWFLDPEQQYVLRVFNTVREAFMINTDMVKPNDLRKFRDLLDPKWKGKISMLDPTRSGTGSNQVAMMEALFGPDFVDKLLIEQKPAISTNRRQLTDWLVRGVHPISFGPEDGEVERLRQEGMPVKTVYGLEDFPGTVSGGNVLSLLDGAPHPNAARVFINWMASKEALEIYGKSLQMVPARADIDVEKLFPAAIIPKAGVNYFDTYDWNFTVTTKGEVRRRMKDLSKAQ